MASIMKVLFVIVVILCTILCVSADNGSKERDCTTTYNLYETTQEEFDKYCEPLFCKCFTKEGCTKEWSKDFVDGLAMMWYFKNDNYLFMKHCFNPQLWDRWINFRMRPTEDKLFLKIELRSDVGKSVAKKLETGTVEFEIYNPFVAMFNTKGLLESQVYISNPAIDFQKIMINRTLSHHLYTTEYSKQINPNNFYPTSLQISFTDNPNSIEFMDNIVLGPFGGTILHQSKAYFQLSAYTDLNQKTRNNYTLRIRATNIEDDFSSTINKRITEIQVKDSMHYMCLGRKINPITKRTHWTGEGCRPVVYYERVPPKDKGTTAFLRHYDTYCHCNFKSLGITYVDEDPNLKRVPEFESPEPRKRWSRPKFNTINESSATKFTVIFSSILLGICLFLILSSFGSVIYYKFLT